jgi:Zn-dependent protease
VLLGRTLAEYLTSGLVLLIAMTVHEFAHNYVGWRMGDPVPQREGRLTLNPLVHIYWPGWIMWVLVGFGILGSAPISEYRMRDRRWGYFWAVLAGPLSNLLLATFTALLYRFNLWEFDGSFSARQVIPDLNQFMTRFFFLNLSLFLFNLLPIYPLDGWHILRKLVPRDVEATMMRYERESTFLLLGLILLSFVGIDILGPIFNPVLLALTRFLLGI